jgi:hypothetical protein
MLVRNYIEILDTRHEVLQVGVFVGKDGIQPTKRQEETAKSGSGINLQKALVGRLQKTLQHSHSTPFTWQNRRDIMFTNMSTLTVIQYTPKVPNNGVPQLPAKPWWTDSRREPVKMLPVSKAAEDNEQPKKGAMNGDDTGPAVDTEKAQGMCLDLLLCRSRTF